MSRTRWLGGMAIAAAIATFDAASAANATDDLGAFLDTYQCSLAGLITKILVHRQSDDQDRFIVLALPGPKASYVQCAFDHKNREGLCEASSGWWNNSWEKPHFSSVELDALRQLGFSTDGSHGNFQRQMRFPPGGPDPYLVARMLLSALYESYGARKGMAIEVVAPFALRHGYLPQERCAVIS